MIMKVIVEEESTKTEAYLEYIVSEILKHEPLRSGKLVEVQITEGITPFPEVSEIPEPILKKVAPTVKSSRKATVKKQVEYVLSNDTDEQILNKKKRFDSRVGAVVFYTSMKLGKYCKADLNESEDDPPARIIFRFTILDPEKIRNYASGSVERLFLNNVGDLWREPKNTHLYSIGEKSNRHKIIRFLVDNAGYQDSQDIRNFIGEISGKVLGNEIGKINLNVSNKLKLKNLKLIESRKGSGYRINQKVEIRSTKG